MRAFRSRERTPSGRMVSLKKAREEALALSTPEYEAAHQKVMEHVRPVIAPMPRRDTE